MADRIFDPDNPAHGPNAQDFDGSWHTFGSRATLDADGNLTGGAARFPNPKPGTIRWVVFKVSDESIIAEVDLAALPGTTAGAWNSFTSANFVSPGDVALDDAEEYIVAVASNGDFVYRDSGVTFPYGTGSVHATEAAFFNGGTGPTFPDSFSGSFMFPADMFVDAGGGPVSAAGTSTAAAVTSSTAAKVAPTASRSTAVATAGSTAAKLTPATGNAAAAAATTTTAVKVVHCTAVCSAAGSTRAAATAVHPAAGTATAAASTTAAATKTTPVSGTTSGIAVAYERALDIRNVTATCYAVATSTLRHRRTIQRPNTGTITRPFTGVIIRP